MTDVSVGFRPPCWSPSGWAPTWRLHTNLYKFGEKASPHILHKKNCCDLNLGESVCIVTFFLFPDSGLNLLNGFDLSLVLENRVRDRATDPQHDALFEILNREDVFAILTDWPWKIDHIPVSSRSLPSVGARICYIYSCLVFSFA